MVEKKKMEKTAKPKNNPKFNDFKIRTCFTSNPQRHEKAGEIGLNPPYFVKKALNWHYYHIEIGDVQILEGKATYFKPRFEKNLKNEWSRRDSNP